MKPIHLYIVSVVSLLGLAVSAAHADAPPKRSKNFLGNYETLVKDQKAAPQIAECIATGRDLVAKNRKYDRLGFTKDNITATKEVKNTQKNNPAKASNISTTITVSGEARLRNGSSWDRINLRCDLSGGKLKAIALSPIKSANNTP